MTEFILLSSLQIRYKNGWKHIIRIWNPWGHGEWKGPWSDKYGLKALISWGESLFYRLIVKDLCLAYIIMKQTFLNQFIISVISICKATARRNPIQGKTNAALILYVLLTRSSSGIFLSMCTFFPVGNSRQVMDERVITRSKLWPCP